MYGVLGAKQLSIIGDRCICLLYITKKRSELVLGTLVDGIVRKWEEEEE